jgi:hypothetical protein
MVKWAQDYDAYKKYQEQDDREDSVYGTATAKRNRNIKVGTAIEVDVQRTFRFDVTVARGGILVTTRRYDPKKDETHEIINVIHEDEDSTKKIADIVAMEIIKS